MAKLLAFTRKIWYNKKYEQHSAAEARLHGMHMNVQWEEHVHEHCNCTVRRTDLRH